MNNEMQDLIDLVNAIATQDSAKKQELLALLAVWDKQLDLLHDFLERVYEFSSDAAQDADDVLNQIDELKRDTRWGDCNG